jgi:hypothetical protein
LEGFSVSSKDLLYNGSDINNVPKIETNKLTQKSDLRPNALLPSYRSKKIVSTGRFRSKRFNVYLSPVKKEKIVSTQAKGKKGNQNTSRF